MNIDLLFCPPMRRWQQRLADELGAGGHRVSCVAAGPPERLPFGVGAALALEQRLFGPSPALFDVVAAPVGRGGPADLVIALDGAVAEGDRVLVPLFDGATGEAALLAMLTNGATPDVRVRLGEADVVSGLLAVEDRTVLSRALDQVLARVVTLIAQAVRRIEDDDLRPPPPPPYGRSPSPAAQGRMLRVSSPARSAGEGDHAQHGGGGEGRGALAFMLRGLCRKLAARLPGGKRGPNHWRVGYRQLSGPGVADTHAWSTQPFTILPEDGTRFLADPMPFAHDGRSYLFFEDFPYDTAKGVIGLVEIADDGTASPPRTVLELPCHLSYPLIIPHGGEIYMLPEMSAAKRLQLFRADPFPDRWVPDRVLLDDIVAADATPVLHQGRWWLFATLSDDGGSTWDALGLFHAPDLLGPWTPHADNPVLVDAGAARPAGAMWHEDGVLMRVAQDCRGGYGVGLAICRVDRLDPEGYAQTVVARLNAPEGTESDGVHTLNRAGDLEVIDLRHLHRPAARRAPGRD